MEESHQSKDHSILKILEDRCIKVMQHIESVFEGKLADVTFLAGENEIKVHATRSVLAAISPVFESMFYGNMKEAQKDAIVNVPDVSPQALECIIKYAYGVNPEIDTKNCIHARYIAEKYLISCFVPFLDEFILCNAEENFWMFFTTACELPKQFMAEKLLGFLPKFDSHALLSSDYFVECLSCDSLKLILASDQFKVEEEYLWERCLQWADYQVQQVANQTTTVQKEHTEMKKEVLNQIKHLIRFPLMSPRFFVQRVYPENVLKPVEYGAILSQLVDPGQKLEVGYSSVSRMGSWYKWRKNLKVGDVIDAKDNHDKWYAAEVLVIENSGKHAGTVKVHYKCWGKKHDRFIACRPDSILPLHTLTHNWIKDLKEGTKLHVKSYHCCTENYENWKWFESKALRVDMSKRRVLVKAFHTYPDTWIPLDGEFIRDEKNYY
mmetsp:Transcript_11817/g.15439  ORF Transcript_11817/g.15439 Transcript_11817/m.15439 type:complete len:437 (+) Transcript_11817:106-1416(+)